MLAKALFFVTLINLGLGTNIELPRNDAIIFPSGEKLEGHIDTVIEGVININTWQGEKIIVREMNIYSARDVVEIGIFKYKRYSGSVKYFGNDYLEMDTSTGKFKTNRALVRKITLSQESTLPPLDL
jgi:hypothetical protein